jgi:putative ABC transport system permease protein
MSLGVALVVSVIVIHNVISDSFNRSAQGYDLIIGPKGSALEVVLSTVFYLKAPVGTVPREFLDELETGKYSNAVEHAIPVTIGHHYRMCPVIGTSQDFFTKLEFMGGKKYVFTEGRNFETDAHYEAVVGARAKIKGGLKLGDEFRPADLGDYSDAANDQEDHSPFKVVGFLGATGTPNDNAIFVNINGFYGMHDIPVPEDGTSGEDGTEEDEDHDHDFSAILVMTKQVSAGSKLTTEDLLSGNIPDAEQMNRMRPDLAAMALPALIDKTGDAQAVSPSKEITFLFDNMIGNVQVVLIMLAVLVIVVAGIGMMVSIYNTMNERRQEIAIMRALGARRTTVMAIILLESILLSLGGGILGVLIGHGLIGIINPWISAYTGIVVELWKFQWSELILIPGLVILASVTGYLPAVVAYKQDVASSLKP